jgi:hypothetical protein
MLWRIHGKQCNWFIHDSSHDNGHSSASDGRTVSHRRQAPRRVRRGAAAMPSRTPASILVEASFDSALSMIFFAASFRAGSYFYTQFLSRESARGQYVAPVANECVDARHLPSPAEGNVALV